MKILVLAPEVFFQLRGSSIRLHHTLTALAEADHKVDLICYPRGESISVPGVSVKPVCFSPSLGSITGRSMWGSPIMNASMFALASWGCLQRRYDVVHVVQPLTWFAGWFRRPLGRKLVCDVHGPIRENLLDTSSVLSRPFISWKESTSLRALSRADMVIARSGVLASSLEQDWPSQRIIRIEDAPLAASFQADEEGAEAIRREFDIGCAPVVLYTGSFDVSYGIETFLRAAPHIRKSCSGVKFLLVGGDGEQVARVQKLAGSLDLTDSCIFTGERPMSAVPACMTAATVLVSPHLRSPYPVSKLFTYMQSGKPIVATRIPAHTEVLDDSCGILVTPDSDAIAEGVLRAIREPLISKALGTEAMSRVASKYSLSSFKHKVRVAYQELGSDL